MNTYEIAMKTKEQIMEEAMVNALAVIAVQCKKEDDISENEAKCTYNAAWLKDRTDRGMLHFSRKGASSKSTKVYSRFEIVSLKIAEKRMAEQFSRAQEIAKEIQEKL